jgi:hypothetical protein
MHHDFINPTMNSKQLSSARIKIVATSCTKTWIALAVITIVCLEILPVFGQLAPGTGFSGFAVPPGNALGWPIWAYRASDGMVSIEVASAAPGNVELRPTYLHKWDAGFSSVTSAGYPYVWAYRSNDGMTAIYAINTGTGYGAGFTQKYLNKWDKGFSGFTLIPVPAGPYMWAYRPSDGKICIHQISSGGAGFTQTYQYNWDKGFASFTTVSSSYVWAYRPIDGMTCIHEVQGDGSGFTQRYQSKWDTGFTHFAGFDLTITTSSTLPYIWAYRASDGMVCIHSISPGGKGFTQKYQHKWDSGFSNFVALSLGNDTYILAYRASDGRICIHRINPGGTGFTQVYILPS